MGSFVRGRHSPPVRLISMGCVQDEKAFGGRRYEVLAEVFAETRHYCSCLFLVQRNVLEPQGLEQKVQGFGKTLLDQVERRVSADAFTITCPPT